MNILKTVVLLSIFVFCSNVFGQNLKGVKEYCLLLFYSDEAKNFKKSLPSEHDIEQQITWNISELKRVLRIGWEYDFGLINISYDYMKSYQETNNSLYYGAITIQIYRYVIIRGSSDVINSQVFVDGSYITMINPTNEMIKHDAEQIISGLITKFGKQYYEDN